MQNSFMIGLIPLLPLIGFITIGLLNRHLTKNTAALIACGAVLAAFGFSVSVFIQLLNNTEAEALTYTAFQWITVGNFSASFSLLADPLSSVMLLIITGVGFLIHVYSIGYMHDDEGFNRFFAYLNLFIFFMLILVMGSNYLLMFVGWEGVGLCSYLLIGFWFENQEYNSAARKAFVMNRIGDLGLILGIILVFIQFDSLEYTAVFGKVASEGSSTTLTIITLLLFIGAVGKSAQIPLFTWLPDAMAGPTPVSALIHAATMVTAGIYMIVRNNILYTLAPWTSELVTIIGLATAILAAIIAVMQNDIKKVLAYSTVSQLGLMFVALGVNAYETGIFHMATHAFFKALLFLGAGSVIHAMSGEQDIRKMGGLKKYLPITWFTFLIGTLAISGIPPFAGFFSKDEILANVFAHSQIIWALATGASLLTAFYMFRLFFLTFSGSIRANTETITHLHESPKSMTIPLVILALFSSIAGFIGIPEILGGDHALKNFLSPVFKESRQLLSEHHLSHSTEFILMGTIVTLTIAVIAAAYLMYVRSNRVPTSNEATLSGIQKLIYRKFYIDELYETIITKPLNELSAMFYQVVELLFIDRLVNGAGKAVRAGSRVIRYVQTGNTGFYIFIMVISVIIILAKTFIS